MASKADKEVAGGKVKEFKGDVDAFKAELSAAKGLVIVDFNAEWCDQQTQNTRTRVISPAPFLPPSSYAYLVLCRCGPCKRIAPVLEELAGENPDILFLGVDVDENEDVTEQYVLLLCSHPPNTRTL